MSYNICETTVKRILKDHGIVPSPKRSKKTTWNEFISTHWESLAAADFFTVEVWTPFGLVRYMVFFVIDLSSRRVEIAGIAPDPNGTWMHQIARNLTDCFDGFLVGKRYLIHDRDPLYTTAFTNILKCASIHCIKLPPKSPNLNAYAERFVRSIKYECLNRMIFFGEKHLRFTINQYVEHYHTERNHQEIGNKLIERNDDSERCTGAIESRSRLEGMLGFYHRRAA